MLKDTAWTGCPLANIRTARSLNEALGVHSGGIPGCLTVYIWMLESHMAPRVIPNNSSPAQWVEKFI